MPRELNRELFGNLSQAKEQPGNGESGWQRNGVPQNVSMEEFKILSFHVDNLNRKLKEMESKVETLASRLSESMSSSKLRFERVQGHFQRQGEMIQTNFRDVSSKVAQLTSRVNERKLAETSMKEMVDRHQQMVQTFEARLTQVQKVISEQELQLMNSRAELKDCMKELARLKRL